MTKELGSHSPRPISWEEIARIAGPSGNSATALIVPGLMAFSPYHRDTIRQGQDVATHINEQGHQAWNGAVHETAQMAYDIAIQEDGWLSMLKQRKVQNFNVVRASNAVLTNPLHQTFELYGPLQKIEEVSSRLRHNGRILRNFWGDYRTALPFLDRDSSYGDWNRANPNPRPELSSRAFSHILGAARAGMRPVNPPEGLDISASSKETLPYGDQFFVIRDSSDDGRGEYRYLEKGWELKQGFGQLAGLGSDWERKLFEATGASVTHAISLLRDTSQSGFRRMAYELLLDRIAPQFDPELAQQHQLQ
jgi:hypothetical protein